MAKNKLDEVLFGQEATDKPQVSPKASDELPQAEGVDHASKKPLSLHVLGQSQMSYLEKVKAALSLLFGGNIFYRFCNAVEPVFSQKGDYLGLNHVHSTSLLVISMKQPKREDLEKLDPVTHLKVTDVIN